MNVSDPSEEENSFEKSMANIIRSQSPTKNDSIDDDLRFNIKSYLQKYESSKTLPFKHSPLTYWKDYESSTEKPWGKALACIAKVYLSAPPTSADVERLFLGFHPLPRALRGVQILLSETAFSCLISFPYGL